MTHVYLVGFMGAGKSTVGRVLADRLGVPFIDLDDRIEASSARSITELFAEEGESGFRARESAELTSLAEEPDAVVACGGGVVLSDENRAFLKRTGRVVYLQVTPGEALARIGGGQTRPLLSGGGGSMAETLLAARRSLYRAVADVTVDTVGLRPAEVAEEIADRLDAREAG